MAFNSSVINIAFASAGKEAAANFAKYAKGVVDSRIYSGKTISKNYDMWINNIYDNDWNHATVPGEIRVNFDLWAEAIPSAIEFLISKSPEKTGKYKGSWIVIVDGVHASEFSNIKRSSEVVITNYQPYHRKIEVGHVKFSGSDRYIVERSKSFVNRKYSGLIEAVTTYITLDGTGGSYGGTEVPYILRGKFRKGTRNYSRKKIRKDVAAGEKMKYPALVMRAATWS